ncbi:hypothetical protein K501DRAFT_273177 [Backusella circina FSU 941]|nr:hypothetical protein K501DRAFT_273177 [Backusella circina FSU 941]
MNKKLGWDNLRKSLNFFSMGTPMAVCSYCNDDSKTFASNQKIRLHVFKFRNVLLPSNRNRGKPVNKEKVNGELYSCPCCVQVLESKSEFRSHVDKHSFKFDNNTPRYSVLGASLLYWYCRNEQDMNLFLKNIFLLLCLK